MTLVVESSAAIMIAAAFLSKACASRLCLIQFAIGAIFHGIPTLAKDGTSLFFNKAAACALFLFMENFLGYWTLSKGGIVPYTIVILSNDLILFAMAVIFHAEWRFTLDRISVILRISAMALIPIIALMRELSSEMETIAVATGMFVASGIAITLFQIMLEKNTERTVDECKSVVYLLATVLTIAVDAAVTRKWKISSYSSIFIVVAFAFAVIVYTVATKKTPEQSNNPITKRMRLILSLILSWSFEKKIIVIIHTCIIVAFVLDGIRIQRKEDQEKEEQGQEMKLSKEMIP